uniref:CSON003537 protein n=1 Tax=Culicoides sonorensis TaxID=179676 RepID=A0A336L1K8_CULSO
MFTLPLIICYVFILTTVTTTINGLNNSDIHLTLTNNSTSPPNSEIIENDNKSTDATLTEHPRLFKLPSLQSSFLSEIFGKENSTTENRNTTNENKGQNINIRSAVRKAAEEGLQAIIDLYEKREKEIVAKGDILEDKSPGAQLAAFSAPVAGYDNDTKLAYGALYTAKKLKQT